MPEVAKKRRPREDLESRLRDVRGVATEIIGLGRRLLVLAHQGEAGEADDIAAKPDPLGERGRRMVNDILDGKGDGL